MYALPAAPPPPPKRQVLVGTALAGVAAAMVVGAMLAIWILQRERALEAGNTWLPDGTRVPEVPTNVMLIGVWGLCIFAQWAVWSARRGDRVHTSLALGLVAVLAVALINAQAFVYSQMDVGVAEETGYGGMFYALTGTMVVLFVVALVFTGIAAFRFLGGRTDREIVAANALFWYILAALFSAVWLIVYVTK